MLFISGAVQDGYDLKLNVMTMVMRRAIGSPICSLLSWHIVHIVYISVYITSMSLPGTLWNGLNMTASFLCVQDIINDTPPIYAKCTFIVPHYWFAIWPLVCVCFAILCVPRCIIIVVIFYHIEHFNCNFIFCALPFEKILNIYIFVINRVDNSMQLHIFAYLQIDKLGS